MDLKLWIPVAAISGIAIAGGYMLNEFGTGSDEKFDERQLIERGRGANLAMTVGVVYLLGLYLGLILELVEGAYAGDYAVFGLVVMMTVYHGYCIFHDAYLNRKQKLGTVVRAYVFMGALLLVSALNRSARWGGGSIWFEAGVAVAYLSQSMMLLLRALVVWLRDRREEKENGDGEK